MSLKIDDPRENYLRLISLERSRVQLRPPIIFLFGGSITDPPTTVRGFVYRHLKVNDSYLFSGLVIPEHFKDWLHDSIYPDLLTFESDLAQTSSLVVIALESPGAIAELGAFSVNSALKEKLIIILSEDHHNKKSFITLGPLRQLDGQNVFAYPFDYENLEESLADYLDDIHQGMSERLEKQNKSEQFNKSNSGHIALLIYEFISIFGALKFKEIQSYLKILLDPPINDSKLRRLIFLLTKLSLVTKTRMGNIDYHTTISQDRRILFSSKPAMKKFDVNAASIGAAAYYHSTAEERLRMRVLQRSWPQ